MTQKLTGNDFDIASPVHGEINKNPWNKDEREQKTKFLPSLCFSGPEINNLPVKSAQSNIIIGSKELGLRPDGTNVQKVGCWQGPVRGKGESFRAPKKPPPMEISPQNPGRSLGCFGTSTAFRTTALRVAPRRVAPNPDRKKIQRFGVMEMVMNLRMV